MRCIISYLHVAGCWKETLLTQFPKVYHYAGYEPVWESPLHAQDSRWEWRRTYSMSTNPRTWSEIRKDWGKIHKESGVSPSSLKPSEGLYRLSDFRNIFSDVLLTSRAGVQSHAESENCPLLLPGSHVPFSERGQQIGKSSSEQNDSLSLPTVHGSRPELGKGRCEAKSYSRVLDR